MSSIPRLDIPSPCRLYSCIGRSGAPTCQRCASALARPSVRTAPRCPLMLPSLQRDKPKIDAPRRWRRTSVPAAANSSRQGRDIPCPNLACALASPLTTHSRTHSELQRRSTLAWNHVASARPVPAEPSPLTTRRPRGLGPLFPGVAPISTPPDSSSARPAGPGFLSPSSFTWRQENDMSKDVWRADSRPLFQSLP